jgi:hypothetical protein
LLAGLNIKFRADLELESLHQCGIDEDRLLRATALSEQRLRRQGDRDAIPSGFPGVL